MGVYRNLSNKIACSHASKKCNLDLSLGALSVLAGVRREVNDLYNDALIPLGGSKTSLKDYLISVEGTFGLNSMVRNNLKLLWGVNLWIIFSTSASQVGAR